MCVVQTFPQLLANEKWFIIMEEKYYSILWEEFSAFSPLVM